MRESLHNSEPIMPEAVEESHELQVWNFKNEDIDVRLMEEVMPYFDTTKDGPKDVELIDLAFAIDSLLSDSNQIGVFEHSDLAVPATFVENTYEPIQEALDQGFILKDAPWFKLLNDKMIKSSIYIAGLTTEESLKKGRDIYTVYDLDFNEEK